MRQGPLILVLIALVPGVLIAQNQSSCGDCHFANIFQAQETSGSGFYNRFDTFDLLHLDAWDRSAHGRNFVGCESCHGGDATTFESFRAHSGILNPRNPASPVHPRNLPKTCGGCHTGQFVAFQNSKHYTLLQEGNNDVPVCSTCHGAVAAQLLSPKALESQCKKCHGENRRFPRPDDPAHAREMLENILEIRRLLDEAKSLMRRVKDDTRREVLEEAYRQAEVPLMEAVIAGHRFVFEALHERRDVARQRAEALLEELANPSGR